jgi:membrane protease YdiL (CAAX protease family)
MFAWLFVRTKSLWPCIIAHFFQDFTALFIPQ